MTIERTMLMSTEGGHIRRIPWDKIRISGHDGFYVSPMPIPENLGQTYASGVKLKIDLLFESEAQPDYEISDRIEFYKSEKAFIALHECAFGQYVTASGQSNEFGFPCSRNGVPV